jgi:hypothetical protein
MLQYIQFEDLRYVVIHILPVLERCLSVRRKMYDTLTTELIWNPDILRDSVMACGKYSDVLSLLLEDEHCKKLADTLLREEPSNTSPLKSILGEDIDNKYEIDSDLVDNLLFRWALDFTTPDYNEDEEDKFVSQKKEGLCVYLRAKITNYLDLMKLFLFNDMNEAYWKVEVAVAFVCFVLDYEKYKSKKDSYNVDLDAYKPEWKMLAFANFYVRRYPPLYLDV